MERNKKTQLLFLLLALPCVSIFSWADCPSHPDEDLPCYNDYNRTITCMWNSTHEQAGTNCTVHAEMLIGKFKYFGSCELKPVSGPVLKKCSLMFEFDHCFQTRRNVAISLSCNTEPLRGFQYKPVCHIKLNPPPEPVINFTTISWLPTLTKKSRLKDYNSQVQFRQKDQPWSTVPQSKQCKENCNTQLPDDLIQGEWFETRVRVQGLVMVRGHLYPSYWSDWSPAASGVALTGRPKPTPPSSTTADVAGRVLGTLACVAAFALLIILRTDKTTWVYIVKRLKGPPLPDPGKSFLQDANFQNLLGSHFTGESFHSFLRPVEIVSVEVSSTLDAVTPIVPRVTLQDKMRSRSSSGLTDSSFSNPMYSPLAPPPVLSITAGNLEACDSDTPYGPVGCCHGDVKNTEQGRDEVRGEEVAILQLLSNGSINSESLAVISDYEKVERPQVECCRLQSLDSGVCSGEEVSQESLEGESINVTDYHEEESEGKEGSDGAKVDFHDLFGGSGAVFDKCSILVCSGYEQVQKLQDNSPAPPSLDSGTSSRGEEQASQEESEEDFDKPTETTCLLFAPPPLSKPLPLNFSDAGFRPDMESLPSLILERMMPMPTNRPVEPSGDGYIPVNQEQS